MLAIIVALRVAGLDPRTLAVGGAFTAVIFGLAAQQTLGNLIAGTVLLSARPFRVGERVRLQGGGIAGQIEGVVSSLGLLYTTFAHGEDTMVPNRRRAQRGRRAAARARGVDLRARLPADVTPARSRSCSSARRDAAARRPADRARGARRRRGRRAHRGDARAPSDGPRLASEVLEAVSAQTGRAAFPGAHSRAASSDTLVDQGA